MAAEPNVIAKKIAFAAEQPVDRRDADALARHLRPALTKIMGDWLGQEEIDVTSFTGQWVVPSALDGAGLVISRQGRVKARRAAVVLSEPLALCAVGHLLQMKVETDPATIDTLRPFMTEAVLGLGEAFDALPILKGLSDGREGWSNTDPDQLASLLGEDELIRITLAFLSPDGAAVSLDLILTPGLLGHGQPSSDESDSEAAERPRQAPRLGPCHVDVTAIADRVRMSVADCSRLELGQVVALPGLRFDHLELTIEMGEGPVRLVDASLGADKGIKAVRLNRGLDPDFKTPMPDAEVRSAPRAQTQDQPSDPKTVHA